MLHSFLTIVGLSSLVLTSQVPFVRKKPQIALSISSLSTEYTYLSHEEFPDYGVRIKRTNFCDETVGVYTGYVDVGTKHLFFYFFESRNDPVNDDVVMWINGGPGSSSSPGLFLELGPCNVKSDNSTEFNLYSWNSNANMIFLDNPVGVGWSYAEYGQQVSDTWQAAKDVASFFAILVNAFPEFKDTKLHLSGESYAGRYLPLFASEIYDQNSRLKSLGKSPVNLASVIIGNGRTDLYNLYESYYLTQCTDTTGLGAFQTISKCVRMKQALPRCQKLVKTHCQEPFDQMNCEYAHAFCWAETVTAYLETGRNMYDVSMQCQDPDDGSIVCYPEAAYIDKFLNQPTTRAALGIDSAFTGNFSSFDLETSEGFFASGDFWKSSEKYVEALLERKIPVLIYAGSYDFICNWLGEHFTTRDLEWHGQAEFGKQELREWVVDGEPAGLTRSHAELTFASVYAAGHLVPHDKPKESLQMLNRWLKGESL